MRDKYMESLSEKISQSNPTDTFVFSPENYVALVDKFMKNILNGNSYNGDIFLAHTIPVYDMYLGLENKPSDTVRVVIFPDVIDMINHTVDIIEKIEQTPIKDEITPYQKNLLKYDVGVIVFNISNDTKFMPIVFDVNTLKVSFDLDAFFLPGTGMRTFSFDEYELWDKTAQSYIAAWYTIQLSLLHPQVKLCFSHPQRQKIKKEHYGKKVAKQYIYIKRHVFDASAFDDALHTDVGDRQYTCLCWRVTGHYRIQNEKKFFISPYWKGPLRKTKTAEARTREVTKE